MDYFDLPDKDLFKISLESFLNARIGRKYWYLYNDDANKENRFEKMGDVFWYNCGNEIEHYLEKKIKYPTLTNHVICHEMFRNAFIGESRMFIQMKNLIVYNPFDEKMNNCSSNENSEEVVTLQCSLLTHEMLDYDYMMFSIMDSEIAEYKNAAIRHYRPYFFSFITEINRNTYEKIKKLQIKLIEAEKNKLPSEEDESPYIWMECTLDTSIRDSININGYVLQSASNIEKIRTDISIIENYDTPIKLKRDILDTYDINSSCCLDDDTFIQMVGNNIGHSTIKDIDVYKIGNGNCIFAHNSNDGFFYDIGFNYRHRPKRISTGKNYNYSDTMKKIVKNNPSCFILSHWDMDHIAGVAVAKKNYFDKDWFAPDCYDACLDAKRLAKYLDLKKHLFLVKRYSKDKTINKESCRLIGKPINIKGAQNDILATYKLYMGGKAKCDGSFPNCEGIVIEYTNSANKVVLMMGDVNYSSFNEARKSNNEPKIADSQIEYLIVPHHGSQHTDYGELVNQNSNSIKKGYLAIICCTNEPSKDRPNDAHRKTLEKRFEVITTEEIPKGDVSKRITL